MRIGIVIPGFSADEEDWCIPVQRDLVRLLSREHEVTVVALRYPHHRRPYRAFGVDVVPLGGGGIRGLARIPFTLRSLHHLRLECANRGIEVLHAMWAHEPGFIATQVGLWLGIPTVVSILGGELIRLPEIGYGGQLGAINRMLTRKSLQRAKRIIVGCQAHWRLASSFVDEELLRLQPMGVDLERFRTRALGAESRLRLDGSPVLIHVGSLVPVKDQSTLLMSFAKVVAMEPGARLHLFGDGELRSQLEDEASRLAIREQVRFHGAVRRELLPDLYSQADLNLLSSRSESIGMVVLEAAACGCPTVGTAAGCIPDHPDFCRQVPVGDWRALADQVVQLVRDESLREAMAQAGMHCVETELSLSRTTAAILGLYGELLEA